MNNRPIKSNDNWQLLSLAFLSILILVTFYIGEVHLINAQNITNQSANIITGTYTDSEAGFEIVLPQGWKETSGKYSEKGWI